MPRARKPKPTNSPPINELGNYGRKIDNSGPDIDPSSKASVEVEGRRVPSDTA